MFDDELCTYKSKCKENHGQGQSKGSPQNKKITRSTTGAQGCYFLTSVYQGS